MDPDQRKKFLIRARPTGFCVTGIGYRTWGNIQESRSEAESIDVVMKLGEKKPDYRHGRYGTYGICNLVKVGFIIERKKCRYRNELEIS